MTEELIKKLALLALNTRKTDDDISFGKMRNSNGELYWIDIEIFNRKLPSDFYLFEVDDDWNIDLSIQIENDQWEIIAAKNQREIFKVIEKFLG